MNNYMELYKHRDDISADEIAKIIGCPTSSIWNLAKRLGCQRTIKLIRTHGENNHARNTQKAFYTYSDMLKMKAYRDAQAKRRAESKRAFEKKIKAEQEKEMQSLKTMKSSHPLVTDARCFNLFWFPETEPKCFEDLGD